MSSPTPTPTPPTPPTPDPDRLHAETSELAHPGPSGRGPGYEVHDANIRAIAVFLVGLIVFGVATQIGLWGLLRLLTGSDTQPRDQTLSAPEVLTSQLRRLHAEEDAALGGEPSWVDRKQGKVRIPIDRAIELIAERGLPPGQAKPMTAVEVNSHAGSPVPADQDGNQKNGKDQEKEQPGDKGSSRPGDGSGGGAK
jgi:hypothetical protein